MRAQHMVGSLMSRIMLDRDKSRFDSVNSRAGDNNQRGKSVTHLDELQQKQLKEAEELFFSGPQAVGFAKDLFFGRFLQAAILPYPRLSDEERSLGDAFVARVQEFVDQRIDPVAIDQNADIPRDVIRGLGEVGVLGATISPEFGGRGL